jgi:hypothetical protein
MLNMDPHKTTSRPSTGGTGFEQPSEDNISRSNYQQKPEETSNITSPSAASKGNAIY